jgi:hypothetical protein
LIHSAIDLVQTGIEVGFRIATELVELVFALVGKLRDLLALGTGSGDLKKVMISTVL